MSPSLFAVETGPSGREKATVNLLPCRIHHDGDVSPSDAFWNPTKTEEGPHTAYLRGRKLHGKAVPLPEGYYGAVVEKTDTEPQASAKPEAGDDDDEVEEIENPEDQLKMGTMKNKATFDQLMIWGHESTSNSTEDPYIRGMEEWISFAEEIHSSEPESKSSN